MIEQETKADLCLCVGTSLSGMNADRMAVTPAKKCDIPSDRRENAVTAIELANATCFGTVMINLQRTHLDEKCTLRIWAKLDDVFALVAKKLGLTADDLEPPPVPFPLPATSVERVYPLPRYGVRLPQVAPDSTTVLDLRDGATVHIVIPEASTSGMVAVVAGEDDEGNFLFEMRREGKLTRHSLLGRWWVRDAMRANVPRMPIMNVPATGASSSSSATK